MSGGRAARPDAEKHEDSGRAGRRAMTRASCPTRTAVHVRGCTGWSPVGWADGDKRRCGSFQPSAGGQAHRHPNDLPLGGRVP
jgi:hypothetical protein